MKNKSAAHIQADLRLMRLAYYEREMKHEQLNRPRVSPLAKATPYLISLGTIIGLIAFLVSLFR